MKTPFKNIFFPLLRRKEIPGEVHKLKTEISKKGNFLKMRNSGKNLKF